MHVTIFPEFFKTQPNIYVTIYFKKESSIEEVSVLEFENADIVRNKIVSKILEVFPDK